MSKLTKIFCLGFAINVASLAAPGDDRGQPSQVRAIAEVKTIMVGPGGLKQTIALPATGRHPESGQDTNHHSEATRSNSIPAGKSISIRKIIVAAAQQGTNATGGPSEIITDQGLVYHGVSIQNIEPDGLTVEYKPIGGGIGMAKLKFRELPESLQRQYGYDAEKAAAYEADQIKANAAAWQQAREREQLKEYIRQQTEVATLEMKRKQLERARDDLQREYDSWQTHEDLQDLKHQIRDSAWDLQGQLERDSSDTQWSLDSLRDAMEWNSFDQRQRDFR